MKFLLFFLCFVYLAFVNAGLFTRYELQTARSNLSAQGRGQAPQRAGPLMQVRQRTLFARRGQYERQRTHVPKSKMVPVPPPKAPPKPEKPKCSLTKQSCVPQLGCCDPCASCHCRFFNAICFCLRKSPQCSMKT